MALYDERFAPAVIEGTVDFLLKSGRALIIPIYKSTYERRDGYGPGKPPGVVRDHAIMFSKDLGRTLDYLHARADIDSTKMAYLGLSCGGHIAPVLLAVEKRFKAAILSSGGFPPTYLLPEVDRVNFTPRVNIPVLLLNGRYDDSFQLESSQLPLFRLVGTAEEAEAVEVPDPDRVAYLTQTTLSIDDTREIVEILKRRFPKLARPAKDDICYATQNRQAAAKTVAAEVDLLLVIGAANSSNANRLVEVSRVMGTPSYLIADRSDIRPEWLDGTRRVGVTAGASTPERLVTEVVEALSSRHAVKVQEVHVVEEDVRFGLPRELEDIARQSGRRLPVRVSGGAEG
jgi:dienelactone hydrolase